LVVKSSLLPWNDNSFHSFCCAGFFFGRGEEGIAHHSPNLKKKYNGLSPSIKINQFKITDNYFFKNRKIEFHIT